jgi:transcriptional regulator with XRE-family HTH domain
VLAERGLAYGDLWEKVQRNKNTYTNWRKKRTIPQISDLEEIALALRIAPGELLRPSDGRESAPISEQLELPFEPGRKGASLELEYTAGGFILKLPSRVA